MLCAECVNLVRLGRVRATGYRYYTIEVGHLSDDMVPWSLMTIDKSELLGLLAVTQVRGTMLCAVHVDSQS